MSRRLPSIPSDMGRGTIEKLKEIAEVWKGERGDEKDRVVTVRDLTESGIGALASRGRLRPGKDVANPEPQRPGPIRNLTATGAFQKVILEWAGIGNEDHAYTEIWRSDEDNLGEAELVGTARGQVFADLVGSDQEVWYWARAVSTTDVTGPWNDTAGTRAKTAVDPEYMLEELTGRITEKQLYKELNKRLDNLDSQWTMQVGTTADGRPIVGGIGLAADEDGVEFGINAHRLWVGDPSDDYSEGDVVFPFIIENGRVYIDTALIKDATIKDAQIESVAADKVSTDSLSAFSSNLGWINGGQLRLANGRFGVGPNGEVVISGAAGTVQFQDTDGDGNYDSMSISEPDDGLIMTDSVIKVREGGVTRVQLGDLDA
ncbi:MAG: phage tail tip fiber protein [Thiohalospira sp.]